MLGENDNLPPPNEGAAQSSFKATKAVKRKRSRAIVSCLYCRERRLKCDQARPKCNSCESRNLDACFYFEEATPELIASERAKIRARKTKITKSRKTLATVPNNVLESSSFINRILPPPSNSDPLQGSQIFSNVSKEYSRDGSSLMVQAQRRNYAMQSSLIEPIVPQMNSNESENSSFLHEHQNQLPKQNQLSESSEMAPTNSHTRNDPLQNKTADKEFYFHSINLFSNKKTPTSLGGSSPAYQRVPMAIDSSVTTVDPIHSDPLAQDISTKKAQIHAQSLGFSAHQLGNSTLIRDSDTALNQNLFTEKTAQHFPRKALDEPSTLEANDHDDASRDIGLSNTANTSQASISKDTATSCASDHDLVNSCNLDNSNGTSLTSVAPQEEGKCPYIHPFTLDFAQSVEPVNPLRQYTIVFATEKAACMVGATSSICLFKKSEFMEENKAIWDAFRVSCEQSSRGDPNGLDGVFKERYVLLRDRGSSLMQEIVATLPSFSSFKKTLFLYFQTAYHSFTNVIDEKTVRHLLEDFVEVDNETDCIISLNVDDRTNFFSVGIILLLYKIVKGCDVDDDCFTEFFCYIRGITSGLTFSLHRIQFLLLNYFQRQFDPKRGAHAGSVHLLAESLGSMTDMLGFRAGVQKHYKDKFEHVGLIFTLQSIWYWSLYADVLNSFENGKSLTVSYGSFDEEELHSLESGRVGKLKRFLVLSRKILFDLNKPRGIPDIEGMLMQIDNYLSSELHPLKVYCAKESLNEVDIFDYVVLAPLIAMKISLWYLQIRAFKNDEAVHKNKLFRTLVTSFKMITALSAHCSHLQASFSGVSSQWNTAEAATNIAFWLKKPLAFRSLITLFDLMYERGKTDQKVKRGNGKYKKNLAMENLLDFEKLDAEIDCTNVQYSSSDMFGKYTELVDDYYGAIKNHLEVRLANPYGSYGFKAFLSPLL
ncbi:hypothetical protein ACO0QE_003238 [Hanseniaspora vineae]